MSHADTQQDIDEMNELNEWLDSLPTSWTTLEGLKAAIEEREKDEKH